MNEDPVAFSKRAFSATRIVNELTARSKSLESNKKNQFWLIGWVAASGFRADANKISPAVTRTTGLDTGCFENRPIKCLQFHQQLALGKRSFNLAGTQKQVVAVSVDNPPAVNGLHHPTGVYDNRSKTTSFHSLSWRQRRRCQRSPCGQKRARRGAVPRPIAAL